MKKIPTLFQRDPDDRRRVLPIVTPGCEWVLAGEGVATRKYDGTCVMYDGENWWGRREVKPGKNPPPGWVQVDHDETTGKSVGWEPIEQASHYKAFAEAVCRIGYDPIEPGTYELIGPKINGNPEDEPYHELVAHETAQRINLPAPLDYRTCARAVSDLGEFGFEGIVWHHPDGRMAKLKARDFPPAQRPQENP